MNSAATDPSAFTGAQNIKIKDKYNKMRNLKED